MQNSVGAKTGLKESSDGITRTRKTLSDVAGVQ
jgi:hypothetical protein